MKWLVVLALLLPASTIRAEPATQDTFYPRISVGTGIGYMVGDVAIVQPTGATFELAAELRITSSVFLRAMYEHAGLTAGDAFLPAKLHATFDGTAALVRHAIFGFGDRDFPVSGDLSVLAGVEYERIAFDGGTPLRRYEAVVGMGGAVVIADEHHRPYQLVEYGFRMMFSRAPDPGKLPFGCDGPCDMPTKTAPYDHSMVMEVSWHFGR